MKRLSFMLIAGEASGDTLAAELVCALREELAVFQSHPTPDQQPLWASLEPEFFGAGGPKMAAAGVKLAVDMTEHSVFGMIDVLKKYFQFRRLMDQLVRLAIERQPDVIVCVDFSGFNRRFARAVKDHVRARAGTFDHWNPRIIQFVSPQVWASRPGRAAAMARDYDLVLSIFPFEPAWYAEHAPQMRVKFVGHPMLDRYGKATGEKRQAETPLVVLLPGSRVKELKRHLPVMVEVAKNILASQPVTLRMVLPSEELAETARVFTASLPQIQTQVGGLAEALSLAELAIASSGTVTMECAFFGVPTVVLYKISWPEFQIGKRIVRVKYIAMPNLLASELVFPEFIQDDATPDNLSRAALEFLQDGARREQTQVKLKQVIASLGEPGASRRAAVAVVKLLTGPFNTPASS